MGIAHEPATSSVLLRTLAGPTDEAAWRRFVGRYIPLIDDACRAARLQPADADEVRSRVLARLVVALREFCYDRARSFRGYLRTTVLNAARSYWRERTRPGATGAADSAVDAQLEQVAVPDPIAELADSIDDDATRRLRFVARVLEVVRAHVESGTWRA
jgi:DNA-directed RNA polymerase specialized sigma24 family protein